VTASANSSVDPRAGGKRRTKRVELVRIEAEVAGGSGDRQVLQDKVARGAGGVHHTALPDP
jgi:hypothetical protein